ncbi:MAG: hypothetical protein LUC97_00835 [Clostridiales bacterium]|nr:hypothetical protein [Clostridiales bacterium]
MDNLYQAFREYFVKKYDEDPILKKDFKAILIGMNYIYHRPHHSRASNPNCIQQLKLKENYMEIINSIPEKPVVRETDKTDFSNLIETIDRVGNEIL